MLLPLFLLTFAHAAEEEEPAEEVTYTPAAVDQARQDAKLDEAYTRRTGGTVDMSKILAAQKAAQDAATAAEDARQGAVTASTNATTAAESANSAAQRAEDAAIRAEAAANAPRNVIVSDDEEEDERDEPEPEDDDGEVEDLDAEEPKDGDKDGVPDAKDECLRAKEDVDGVSDKDGCPDDGPRFGGFVSAGLGLDFRGGNVEDADGNTVAGPMDVPLLLSGGILYGERGTDAARGKGFGLSLRGGVVPGAAGHLAYADVLFLSTSARGGAMGIGIGGGMTAIGSLEGTGMEAYQAGGELMLLSRTPVSRTDQPNVTDLNVAMTIGLARAGNEVSGVWVVPFGVQLTLGRRWQGIALDPED